MARQAGPLYFTGTIDAVTFYKMDGHYYARKKSSLDRKRFRTDPRFARSRKSAKTFGQASQLASTIYWQLPKEQRGKGVIGRLTAAVSQRLNEGHSPEQIIHHYHQQYTPEVSTAAAQNQPKDTAKVPPPLSTWQLTASGGDFRNEG